MKNMLIPIIVTLVSLLLFILIGYNIIAQYKEKIESEKRILLAKQGAIITEVDDLLLKYPLVKYCYSYSNNA